MRKRYSVLGLSLCLLLVGCQGEARISGGDPLFATQGNKGEQTSRETSVDVLADQAQRSEREQELFNKISDFFHSLKAIKVDLNATVTTDKFEYHKKQANEEAYNTGAVVQYHTETDTTINGESLKQSLYLTQQDGDKEKDKPKTYSRINGASWEESYNGRTPTLYLHLIKFLLEGSDQWKVEDGLSQPLITKKITHSEHLQVLGTLLDLPVAFTPNAQYDMSASFQVDEAKGLLTNAVFEGTVVDLGKTYQLRIQARPNYDEAFKEFSVDVKQKGTVIETTEENFLDQFKQANLLNPLYFYETTVSERSYDDQQTTWLKLGNYLNQTPLLTVQGKIENESLGDYHLNYNNKLYGVNKDRKLTQVDDKTLNYYANAVKQFVANYDALTTVEQQPDEETGEVTTISYRQQFESDYEGFVAAGGDFDVSRLKRDEDALYGVDYVIDKATLRLTRVYYWSLISSDEGIQQITIMRFDSFNEYNPNNFIGNVSDVIWEAIQ